MSTLIIYFIKVNIAIALFYLFYRLFFAGDTLWRLRRMYLGGSMLISFTYPFLTISEWMKQSLSVQEMISNYSILLKEITITTKESAAYNFTTFFYLFYASVSVLLLIRLVVQIISVLNLHLQGRKVVIDQTKVIQLDKKIAPFSFFNKVYINPSMHTAIELKEILAHEHTHVRQLHSFDVMIGELMTIICWINPAVWLLKREIRQNLEFLADNQVLESGFDARNYQYHLIRLAYQTPEIKLTNNFNVSPLKKRITMMNQKKTPKTGMLKYLLIVPIVSALVISSNAESMLNSAGKTINEQTPPPPPPPVIENDEEDVVFMVVEKMPQYPGGDEELFKYLATNIKYPSDAKEQNIEGRVICQFVINRDGSVAEVVVVRSIAPSLDAEAVRVISAMPNWTPGEQRGQTVRVKYTLPINFKLDSEKKAENTKKD